MMQYKVVIKNKAGFHLRPAASFVSIVRKSHSSVRLIFKEKNISGSSLLEILKLRVEYGSQLVIKIEGPDEEEVMESLKAKVFN